jgi:hypothetical protein
MKFDDLNGTGTQVWGIIYIDSDDFEDTSLEMWLADSEEHLYDQVVEHHDIDEMLIESFKEDWGYKILPKRIGEFINTKLLWEDIIQVI